MTNSARLGHARYHKRHEASYLRQRKLEEAFRASFFTRYHILNLRLDVKEWTKIKMHLHRLRTPAIAGTREDKKALVSCCTFLTVLT